MPFLLVFLTQVAHRAACLPGRTEARPCRVTGEQELEMPVSLPSHPCACPVIHISSRTKCLFYVLFLD